jgi:hypothetical protein
MSDINWADLKQLAWRTFMQDLPKLYEERPGQFVAYRGDQVIAYGIEKHLLYQECYARGLRDEEFIIFCIEPWEDEVWTTNMAAE